MENINTDLLKAAKNGDMEKVQLCLQQGADINITNENGWSPLFHAVHYNQKEVVRFLLENGADTNLEDHLGRKPFQLVEDAEMAKLMLKHGVDVNVQSRDGRTLLHDAAAGYDQDTILAEVLIEQGANVNLKDEEGETPLFKALLGGKEIAKIKLLLANGADIDAQDNYYKTPLYKAVYYQHHKAVKLLLEQGADQNLTIKGGRTPRQLAESRGFPKMLEIFHNFESNSD